MSLKHRKKVAVRDARRTERQIYELAKEVILKERKGEPVGEEFEITTRRRKDQRTDKIQSGKFSNFERGRIRMYKAIISKKLCADDKQKASGGD